MSGDVLKRLGDLLGRWLSDVNDLIADVEKKLDECLHLDFADKCVSVAARYKAYSEELGYWARHLLDAQGLRVFLEKVDYVNLNIELVERECRLAQKHGASGCVYYWEILAPLNRVKTGVEVIHAMLTAGQKAKETIVDHMVKTNREVWEHIIKNMSNILRDINRYLPNFPIDRNHPLYQLIIGTFIERNPNYLSYYGAIVNDLKNKIENVLDMIKIIKRNIEISNQNAYKDYMAMIEKKEEKLKNLKEELEKYFYKIYEIWNNEQYRKGIESGDHVVIHEILKQLATDEALGILYEVKKELEDTYRVFKAGETFYNVPLVRATQAQSQQAGASPPGGASAGEPRA